MEECLAKNCWARCAAVACAVFALPAQAQDFYRGKTINLIVGNAAGGGYDIYARLLARHMGRYIPGEPNFVVRNMPGAGGMALSNHIYSQAPRDGLTIGMMSRSNPIEPLLGNTSAKYKAEEFLWLGTPSSYEDDSYCIVIRADFAVKSIADLRSPAARSGSAGLPPAAPTPTRAHRARRVQAQHRSSSAATAARQELNLAIQRGEVEGRGIGVSSIPTRSPTGIATASCASSAIRPRDALEGSARRTHRARARDQRRTTRRCSSLPSCRS